MSLDRRKFLTTGAAGLLGASLFQTRGSAADTVQPFTPRPDDTDENVFAEARKQFLFPTSVTYGNTGTLGACPRAVMQAYLGGLERLERGSGHLRLPEDHRLRQDAGFPDLRGGDARHHQTGLQRRRSGRRRGSRVTLKRPRGPIRRHSLESSPPYGRTNINKARIYAAAKFASLHSDTDSRSWCRKKSKLSALL